MAGAGSVLLDAWVVAWADMEGMEDMEQDMVADEEWEEGDDGDFDDGC